jgi:serine-type D-Ala-D-Ala carboxypeptidase/endopeptidase (penicillin-binding protein 4)
MKGRLPAAVFSLSLLLACRGTPAPSLPSPPASASPDRLVALQQHVAELLANPDVAAGTWGVDVRSLQTHDTLIATNAHRLLTPASTMKTLTLAVAGDQLGWDFTYETRVVPHGSIADGVLNGDLVIVGSGDPSLDDWDGGATTVFGSWAARLRELGVHAVTGRIVGDDRVFSDDGLGSGWMWDDLAFSYSAPASGLQFNEGAAQVVVAPGAAIGDAATLSLAPAYADVALRGSVKTVQQGGGTSISMQQSARSSAIGFTGTIALDAGRQVRTIAVPNPTQYFVSAVRNGLIANGIDVHGSAVDVDDLAEGLGPDRDGAMVTHRSPVLSSLADTLMKLSQNMYAETLLRTLGRQRSGVGTADAGRAVVRDVLTSWGIPPAEVLMADGSGLSRYNLVTADAMVTVLAHVYDDVRLRQPYLDTLPIAGRAGTLSARMKGTAADGNVHAKTGSFTNARAVAGFVRTADGEPLAFSIIANNYGAPPDTIDRVTDAIIVSLAEFRRGVPSR